MEAPQSHPTKLDPTRGIPCACGEQHDAMVNGEIIPELSVLHNDGGYDDARVAYHDTMLKTTYPGEHTGLEFSYGGAVTATIGSKADPNRPGFYDACEGVYLIPRDHVLILLKNPDYGSAHGLPRTRGLVLDYRQAKYVVAALASLTKLLPADVVFGLYKRGGFEALALEDDEETPGPDMETSRN